MIISPSCRNISSSLLRTFSLHHHHSPTAAYTTTLQDIATNHKPGLHPIIFMQLLREHNTADHYGSPMVYSGAVDRIIGKPPPKTGDIVLVAGGTEKPIAWGLYNSVSMFCVRLMQLEDEAARDPSCALDMARLLETRIGAAIELWGFPPHIQMLTTIRGLIVDVFGELAVIASSAAWVEKYRQEIESYVSRINEIKHIKWRQSADILKEEGLELTDLGDSIASPALQTVKLELARCPLIKVSLKKIRLYIIHDPCRAFKSFYVQQNQPPQWCMPFFTKLDSKEVWLNRMSGGVCTVISAKGMSITGIEDRRYWNWISTKESRLVLIIF
ncbi:hypothetical protein MKX01_039511 [Papaver californicum]|nr:hypothetical protein MKX01_039511 [Papaver californicum]